MFLPASLPNQRCAAEIGLRGDVRLAVAARRHRVALVKCGSRLGAPLTHLDHTPSPLGQQGAFSALLSAFSGALVLGEMTKKSALRHGPIVLVRGAGPSRQGTEKGPSRALRAPLSYAAALPLAATRLPNRASWALPSAQVLRPSPAAAFCKGRPSVRPVTSPIASLTRANADPSTNLTSAAQSRCRIRLNHPAQHPLLRGFRVSLKTQKDTPCSRKS